MIRYKEREFENYFIDPETAIITDKNGVVQKTCLHRGRVEFKNMHVHRIQVHTHLGYKPDYVVHHLDENPLNNSLSNLVYLSRSEHTKLHHLGKISGFCGYHHSEDVKAKISITQTGMKRYNNGIKNTWAKEKPGPEWKEGWIKKRRTV